MIAMEMIRQHFAVNYAYSVYFTADLFRRDNTLLSDIIRQDGQAGAKKILAIVDDGVAASHPELNAAISLYSAAYPETLSLVCEPLIIPGGENAKNDPSLLARIQEAVNTFGLCRHSFIMAIGGGALLDMVGYAAATVHRGIRLIRVPTTVLAQNDTGVGVKNAVNAYYKKNFLGTFAPPYVVLNASEFLRTLNQRDWLAGAAEAIKVALVKDPEFFEFLERSAEAIVKRDMPTMQNLIRRCAELHLNHIATCGEPFERGTSRPLDFGHWAAHKLEQLSNYSVPLSIWIRVLGLYKISFR
jgi:3-dehydroquinate synthase